MVKDAVSADVAEAYAGGLGVFKAFWSLFRLQFAIDHVLKRVHVFCWVLLAPGLRWQVMLQPVVFGPFGQKLMIKFGTVGGLSKRGSFFSSS